MKYYKYFFTLFLIPAFIISFTGCDDDKDKGTGPSGGAPVISSLTADPDSVHVDLDSTSTLTVVASDPDGDQLDYSWDATAGNFNGPTDGTTVEWVAPNSVLQSIVTVEVSDGNLAATEAYTFKFDSFAVNIDPPEIDASSVVAIPGYVRVVTPATQTQWWLELYAKVIDDQTAASEIVRLTAEPGNGTIYDLRDDGFPPDIAEGDNEFYGYPGGHNMEVDTGLVRFVATNKYGKHDTVFYNLDYKLETLPMMIAPDSVIGDVFVYNTGTPLFEWEADTVAEYFRVALTDTNYHFYAGQPDSLIIWQPVDSLPGDATSILYNYDGQPGVPLLLDNYNIFIKEYIFHLTSYKNNAWSRQELRFQFRPY